MNFPKTIQNLIEVFRKFPGIGPRQATRFAFHILKLTKSERDNLISAVSSVDKIKFCQECYLSFEDGSGNLCPICSSSKRDKKIIALVEKEIDAEALEKTGRFLGVYHILGGDILNNRDSLKTKELVERIKKNKVIEVILALNPTTEGEATALHLQRILKPYNIKITRLARGLPTGSEIEYADANTLIQSLNDRK